MGNETSKKSKKSYAFEIIDEHDELNPEEVKQIVASEVENAICSIETNIKLKNEPPLPDTSSTELGDNENHEKQEIISKDHPEKEPDDNSSHLNEKTKENETDINLTEVVDTIKIETHSALSCQIADAANRLTSGEGNHENQETEECTLGEIKTEDNVKMKEKKRSKKEKDFTKRKESKKKKNYQRKRKSLVKRFH